jgi:lipoprotein-releasing system ATP-binding protein
VPNVLVAATDVQKSFRHMGRTLEVLRGVNLEIGDGEMLGIVGPSGAGKSTLLHCIGTLDVPTKGSIRIAGEEVTTPGLVQGRPKREFEPRARALLEEVGLESRILHRPGELSGGEQQRVALARALVLEPKLLLADEPTGNLDSATSEQIHELFFGINKHRGTTIVVVTHNPALAASMPRIVTLRDGNVEKDERKGEVDRRASVAG